jgi:hypothetical protein
MNGKKGFFKRIKERLFGKETKEYHGVPTPPATPVQAKTQRSIDSESILASRQDPYFIQIGFDFGTSFCKCICRDVMTNKAWIFFPPGSEKVETPFLIPTTLLVQNGKIRHPPIFLTEYQDNGLPHLKLALVKAALHQWDDPVLTPYKNVIEESNTTVLADFVEMCAVYYLAGAFGDVRKDLLRKYPDFGSQPQDYMAVNLAVPVADAQRPEVEGLYQRILCKAWSFADQLAGYPQASVRKVAELISGQPEHEYQNSKEACFIYPEVSANVQGFVRSRASSPGIYLFSDTGAGTVDQSIFIFFRQDDREHLTYLHGSVLPQGSSRIEHLAAIKSGSVDAQSLEIWRKKKEAGGKQPELQIAMDTVRGGIRRGTYSTLDCAKKKLHVEKQLYDLRIIFGGGGHCTNPYKIGVMDGVMKTFSGPSFPKGVQPDIVGLPTPSDLELGTMGKQWMQRLSVAYGLSFVRTDLTDHTYPKDLKDPDSTEILHPLKPLPEPPTKDVC